MSTDMASWKGMTMVGADEEKIGKISEIYEDPATGKAEWATVNTGMFGTKSNFVPLAGATEHEDHIDTHVTKEQVKNAPAVEDDGQLTEEEEVRLFEHYGVPYTMDGSVTAQGAPTGTQPAQTTTGDDGRVGRDTSGATTDEAMTRSEEELRVGTQEREIGRARLRKYVVTEQVTQTVPVSHEEVTIEREPITDANRDAAMDGPEISEEEHEVVLHGDEVIVDKEVVAKERVQMGVKSVTEDQQVNEEVRKERVEAEGTPPRP